MSRAPAAAAADPAPAYRRKARREWSGDMVRNLRLCDGWDRGGQARERYPAAGGAQTTVTGPPPGGLWKSAPPGPEAVGRRNTPAMRRPKAARERRGAWK